jgi:hypothetical protein
VLNDNFKHEPLLIPAKSIDKERLTVSKVIDREVMQALRRVAEEVLLCNIYTVELGPPEVPR